MNKRVAKQNALRIVAVKVWDMIDDPDTLEGYDDDDKGRMVEGLRQLKDELYRRSGRGG